jgi:hypothetical protein
MTAKIFSVETAKRLFKDESDDLVLCHENMIKAASAAFEADGDYASASDIIARYEDMQETMRIMIAQAIAEFC